MKRPPHLSSRPLAALFVFTTSALSLPAVAFTPNEFQVCAAILQDAKIDSDKIPTACAQALHPKELSKCVLQIKDGTKIEGDTAVINCFRVRRPLELSQCVTQIVQYTRDPVQLDVLDYCRRSLLPIRYSECVVGLSVQVKGLTPSRAMETCISALDWPNELYPSFVPTNVPPSGLQ